MAKKKDELVHEYPKHMYNGAFRAMPHRGDPEPVFKVVHNEDEEAAAAAKGWSDDVPERPAPAGEATAAVDAEVELEPEPEA